MSESPRNIHRVSSPRQAIIKPGWFIYRLEIAHPHRLVQVMKGETIPKGWYQVICEQVQGECERSRGIGTFRGVVEEVCHCGPYRVPWSLDGPTLVTRIREAKAAAGK